MTVNAEKAYGLIPYDALAVMLAFPLGNTPRKFALYWIITALLWSGFYVSGVFSKVGFLRSRFAGGTAMLLRTLILAFWMNRILLPAGDSFRIALMAMLLVSSGLVSMTGGRIRRGTAFIHAIIMILLFAFCIFLFLDSPAVYGTLPVQTTSSGWPFHPAVPVLMLILYGGTASGTSYNAGRGKSTDIRRHLMLFAVLFLANLASFRLNTRYLLESDFLIPAALMTVYRIPALVRCGVTALCALAFWADLTEMLRRAPEMLAGDKNSAPEAKTGLRRRLMILISLFCLLLMLPAADLIPDTVLTVLYYAVCFFASAAVSGFPISKFQIIPAAAAGITLIAAGTAAAAAGYNGIALWIAVLPLAAAMASAFFKEGFPLKIFHVKIPMKGDRK